MSKGERVVILDLLSGRAKRVAAWRLTDVSRFDLAPGWWSVSISHHAFSSINGRNIEFLTFSKDVGTFSVCPKFNNSGNSSVKLHIDYLFTSAGLCAEQTRQNYAGESKRNGCKIIGYKPTFEFPGSVGGGRTELMIQFSERSHKLSFRSLGKIGPAIFQGLCRLLHMPNLKE